MYSYYMYIVIMYTNLLCIFIIYRYYIYYDIYGSLVYLLVYNL